MPNFVTAPWVDIDLSGTKLRFKNPPKSQGLIVIPPPECGPEKLDIYNLDNFKLWPNEKGGVETILKNYWSIYRYLFDNNFWDVAELNVKIIVTRLGIKQRPYDNLLYPQQSLHWCFDCQYDKYNGLNNNIKKDYPQRLTDAMEEFGTTEFEPMALYTHPQIPSDIEAITSPTGVPFFSIKLILVICLGNKCGTLPLPKIILYQ